MHIQAGVQLQGVQVTVSGAQEAGGGSYSNLYLFRFSHMHFSTMPSFTFMQSESFLAAESLSEWRSPTACMEHFGCRVL